MKKTVLALLAASAFAVPAARAQSPGPNLVLNPGFETGDFTDWTITPAASGSLIEVGGSDPHSGTYEADFGATQHQYDTISQTLSTVPGAFYEVGFYLDETDDDDTTDPMRNSFLAQFGGSTLFTLNNVPPQTDYDAEYTATVQATGTSAVLAFSGYNGPGYDFLDDVSVTAVPEPSPWAISVLSLAALGVVLRRRAGQSEA